MHTHYIMINNDVTKNSIKKLSRQFEMVKWVQAPIFLVKKGSSPMKRVQAPIFLFEKGFKPDEEGSSPEF